MSDISLEQLTSLCKRRGFVFPASDIYGGLAGFWDYGPYGTELATNLKNLWWKAVVKENREIFGLDGAIIQNPKLWEASGHLAGFNDPLIDCKNCQMRFRADSLIETNSSNIEELTDLLKDKPCPNCGKDTLTAPRQYNLMMKTWVGPVEDDSSVAYLRPETAGSIFTNFANVLETTRSKVPFGIAQIGKAFRNEISPRDFIFRVRELEQMELQYFIDPKDQDQEYKNGGNLPGPKIAEKPAAETKAAAAHSRELDAAISSITKSYGEGSIMRLGDARALVKIEVIPTGALALDLALGVGGIPRRPRHRNFGPESSGKTTLMLHVIANAQKTGGLAAFIDAEHALDPGYAKKLGVNLDDLLVSQPDSGEEALTIL